MMLQSEKNTRLHYFCLAIYRPLVVDALEEEDGHYYFVHLVVIILIDTFKTKMGIQEIFHVILFYLCIL